MEADYIVLIRAMVREVEAEWQFITTPRHLAEGQKQKEVRAILVILIWLLVKMAQFILLMNRFRHRSCLVSPNKLPHLIFQVWYQQLPVSLMKQTTLFL